MDEKTGDVIACNLTSKTSTDASRVPALLDEVDRPIASFRADSQYDTEGVYRTVESHRPDRSPRVLIPPKKNALIKPDAPVWRERNRNIRSRARHGKRAWHQKSGYSLRAKVETTVSRYKTILGPRMRSRKPSCATGRGEDLLSDLEHDDRTRHAGWIHGRLSWPGGRRRSAIKVGLCTKPGAGSK